MDSSNNNTGYVDYIMDYAKVLVPFYPSRMSSHSSIDTKIKLCFPKNPPWTLSCAYKTILDQIISPIATSRQGLRCSQPAITS